MINRILYITIVSTFAIILFSCSPTRNIPEGAYLLNRNKIKIDKKNINTDELYSYIKQKSNRRILFYFRFHLGAYNFAKLGKKESRFDKWILNAIGEPPVILDTLLCNKSVKQIKLYMNSKGYFNSVVNKQIKYVNKKKANINFVIKANEPYKFNKITYLIKDQDILTVVLNDTSNSIIIKGNNFDSDILQKERERISTFLKNEGYYFFEKEFISYNIDSTIGNNLLNVVLEIKNPINNTARKSDSIVYTYHKKYKINNIFIYPEYNSLDLDTSNQKIFKYFAKQRNFNASNLLYNFIYKDTFRLKPKTITQSVFLKQDNYFRIIDVEQTYNRLNDLKIFKFVNIQFVENTKDTSNNGLNGIIQLTKRPIQSTSIESEATNSAGNLGLAGNFIYQNRNLFKGAEIFKFKISGALEIHKLLNDNSIEEQNKFLLFNTIETGAEVSLDIPKFLIPVRQERFSKYFKPKTTINSGIRFQQRPDFTRYILNASFGYDWKESQTKRHILYPADINSVKIQTTEAFQNIINSINDPKILNSYKDHLTMALKYSFIFNNQQTSKKHKFNYFRGNFETSGNLLRLSNHFFNKNESQNAVYKVLNIQFAQYVRADIDFRQYFVYNEFNTLVLRGVIGTGLAYGNSSVMPFEKSFFSGGANSIRAWKIYSLGPGSSKDTINLNKTGDINLEGNIEYRFPIYSYLKGAFFVDAGNIWVNKRNSLMPDAEFKWNRFYKEIAVGAGFGARFDFSFFILRVDMAIPLRNPAVDGANKWLFKNLSHQPINLNLGIGYPF
ncbi:MAG TPA: BamA/TamA family outer membrane protein [Bacteroidales bacterium]|nr:BamA/TamA family outer membrane protein [Bacteroidales bacterium]